MSQGVQGHSYRENVEADVLASKRIEKQISEIQENSEKKKMEVGPSTTLEAALEVCNSAYPPARYTRSRPSYKGISKLKQRREPGTATSNA